MYTVSPKPMTREQKERQAAVRWFESRGFPAYEANEDVFVEIGCGIHVAINASEVANRADEYTLNMDLEP